MKPGWQLRKIGDYCEVIAGQSPEGKNYNSDGHGMPFYQGKKDFGDRFIEAPTVWTTETTKVARKNDILMSVRAPVGPINLATADICIGRGLAAIRCNHLLDLNFLFYQLLLLQPEIFGREGAVFASINKSEIAALPIVVGPLPEQQRIVTLLDEAFDGIATAKAHAEKNLQNARAIFESHLQSVFDDQGAGWKCSSFEDAVDSECTLSYGIVQPGEEYAGGMPIVRPTDLGRKTIEIEGLKRIDPALAASYRRTNLRGGDLLLCVRGTTGQISIASTELAGANVTRGIVPIFFEATVVAQDFGYYLMCSGFVQTQIQEKTYGTALQQINIGDLRKLKLAIPPLAEQAALTARFDELGKETQRLEVIFQQKLTALDELKKSLLHRAFNGDL